MSIVNDIQQLVARSRLFVDAGKLEKMKGKKLDRRRGKAGREAVKIGQGGTLDPLADGVLGKLLFSTEQKFPPESTQYPSDWSWERNQKIERIPELRQSRSGICHDNISSANCDGRNTKRHAYLGAKPTAMIAMARVFDLHHGNILQERKWKQHSPNLGGRSHKYHPCMCQLFQSSPSSTDYD